MCMHYLAHSKSRDMFERVFSGYSYELNPPEDEKEGLTAEDEIDRKLVRRGNTTPPWPATPVQFPEPRTAENGVGLCAHSGRGR